VLWVEDCDCLLEISFNGQPQATVTNYSAALPLNEWGKALQLTSAPLLCTYTPPFASFQIRLF